MLSAFSAAILGFLLGLRHATDADHVVAVSAIVARERTMRRAAWIGVLWGIGHSITVFVVGGAIIAFRLVIPPRLGLALEFGVALMLGVAAAALVAALFAAGARRVPVERETSFERTARLLHLEGAERRDRR